MFKRQEHIKSYLCDGSTSYTIREGHDTPGCVSRDPIKQDKGGAHDTPGCDSRVPITQDKRGAHGTPGCVSRDPIKQDKGRARYTRLCLKGSYHTRQSGISLSTMVNHGVV